MSETSMPPGNENVKSASENAFDEAHFYDSIEQIASENLAIDAVVQLIRAQVRARDAGIICLRMEQGMRSPSTAQERRYIEAALKYRQALAEMSAARYALVTVLGW